VASEILKTLVFIFKLFKLMAAKKKAAKKKAKHMAYYCMRCGWESGKKAKHHGKMMAKC